MAGVTKERVSIVEAIKQLEDRFSSPSVMKRIMDYWNTLNKYVIFVLTSQVLVNFNIKRDAGTVWSDLCPPGMEPESSTLR